MMHYSRYKISEFVDLGSSIIQVATKDIAIRHGMAEVGYSAQKLSEGESLYQNFRSMTLEHESLTQKKKEINQLRNELHLSLKKDYMRVVKISRIAFQDQEPVRLALALDGEREKTMDAWLDQGQLFCNRLLSFTDYLSALLVYGVSDAYVQTLILKFNELREISAKKKNIEDNLLLLTKRKRVAMLVFQRWLSDYVKMARIRFDDDPDMLEHLRIKL